MATNVPTDTKSSTARDKPLKKKMHIPKYDNAWDGYENSRSKLEKAAQHADNGTTTDINKST